VFFSPVRGGAVGLGNALKVGKKHVRFPMESLEFLFKYSFRPYYDPATESVSNRNEYQKYFLEIKAAGA
jgi:hypothetical protein